MDEIRFTKVSDIVGSENKLEVCTASCNPISVLQWQCFGEFEPNTDLGVKLEDELFYKKASSFIELAKKSNADLVLTPEYSFPYRALENIISNRDLWPEKEKLWCLCAQGDNRKSFECRIAKWSCKEGIRVFDSAFKSCQNRTFISPLIYLFRSDKGELCILPQLKTNPMSDSWNEFEKPNLCSGNEIFVFDLDGGTNSENGFLSLICADILHVKPDNIKKATNGRNTLIFNPQLNPKPRNDKFRDFRNHFFNFAYKRRFRIITLNWAEGTIAKGTTLKFDTPWSAFHKKYDGNLHGDRELRRKNHKNGTSYILNDYTDIWFSHSHEHCKLYEIKKEDCGEVAYEAASGKEPITKGCYIFLAGEEKWTMDIYPCKNDLKEYISEQGEDYNFPLLVCKNSTGKCENNECEIDKCDFFFDLCFGSEELDELKVKENEIVERLAVKSDLESDKKRSCKAGAYRTLITLLKQDKFPEALNYLKENHKFDIYYGYPDYGKKGRYNLIPKKLPDDMGKDLEVLAVIAGQLSEGAVKSLEKRLSDCMDRNYRDQILIYYIPDGGTGYEYYDKHLSGTSIMKTKFSQNLASIK